jgi:hypothetical protein
MRWGAQLVVIPAKAGICRSQSVQDSGSAILDLIQDRHDELGALRSLQKVKGRRWKAEGKREETA